MHEKQTCDRVIRGNKASRLMLECQVKVAKLVIGGL